MILTPLSVLDRDVNKAVVFLNHANSVCHKIMELVWAKSFPVAFVDGFANLVYNHPKRNELVPQFVTGDFDSIEPHVLDYYRSHPDVSVIETPDQNETDLTKCLRIITDFTKKENINPGYIVCVGASGGRFDHEMGLIKSLFDAVKLTSIPTMLLSECSITFLLIEGRHIIYADTGFENGHIGLIPINGPSTVTTVGLKWDLTNSVLSFDGLVSTSNLIKEKLVEVNCSSHLLFTMEYDLSVDI